MNVLALTSRHGYWQDLAPDFAAGSFTLNSASTIDEALDMLRSTPPALVILDMDPEGGNESQAENIRRVKNALAAILRVNAMVHAAVISGLSERSFHDAMEGYGVLLHIPPDPGARVVQLLSGALQGVGVPA